MRGDACSTLCGFCGACTFAHEHEDESSPVFCGTCEKLLGPLDYKMTMAFGTFCSTACADAKEKKFSARHERRQRRTA